MRSGALPAGGKGDETEWGLTYLTHCFSGLPIRMALVTTSNASPRRAVRARTDGAARTRQRLKAPERRHMILVAARKAFSKSGDLNGTTIRAIAQQAKISEGVIYQHFESKEELFFEAIVEPLRRAIASVVDEVGDFNPVRGANEDIAELTRRFWTTMMKTMDQILPLLGLVLFSETTRARAFYRGPFTDAVNELADTWQHIYDKIGVAYNAREVALASIGIAISFSLDSRYQRDFDLESTVEVLTAITHGDFWPALPDPNDSSSTQRR
jgi:AcrR family transcriptional regulator